MSSEKTFLGKKVDETLVAQPDYYSLYLEIKLLGEVKTDDKIIGEFKYFYGGGQGEVVKLNISYMHNTKTKLTTLETEYKGETYSDHVYFRWEEGEYPFMRNYDKNFRVYHNRITIKNENGDFCKIMEKIKPNSLFQMIEGEEMMPEMKACFYSKIDMVKDVAKSDLSKEAITWKDAYNKRIEKYYKPMDDGTYSNEHISIGASV